MKCPKCDVDMEEKTGRIKGHSPFTTNPDSIRSHSYFKLGRYFHCPSCGGNFAPRWTLVEVEVHGN